MAEQNYISGSSAVNIAGSVEAALAGGKLGAGESLPTVRELAARLSVSPATVAGAFRILKERGVIVADRRRGTRVRPAPPIALPAETAIPEGVRNLADGNPDLRLLPDLGKRRWKLSQRLYGDELNDPELLALARERFREDSVPNEHVAIVSGALDGIERVLREHLRAGDRVAVEDPCFIGALDLLSALALVAVPVAVDDEGLVASELKRALPSCKAVVVTPRAQNPTGAAHSPRRARELRAILAQRPDVLVVEDDHAGIIAGAEYRTLVDKTREKWAVVHSVSKSFGPDIRVALLASDARTHARVEGRQTLGIRWVSHILQRTVVAIWRDRAPLRAQRVYAERRDALLRELRARGVPAHGVSGLNVWIPVAEESTVVQALTRKGWGVHAGERYRVGAPPAIRVTISTLEPRDATAFARDLVEIVTPKAGRAFTRAT
jgi:DNA-binding transcriptional MocR family regulator